MYKDIPDEIVVKKITGEEKEEEEKDVTNLVGNQKSGCRIDDTQRFSYFS